MFALPDRTATLDAPVLDVFAERWSARIFDESVELDEAAFASALEAARWAPSAFNSQPWRFIVARRGSAAHTTIVDTLTGFNQSWAPAASALLVVVTETQNEDGKPLGSALYDAGQAAAYFTVQAHASGLVTHQMTGFDREAVGKAFSIGDRFEVVTAIAVGALGDFASASETLQARDAAPRTRRAAADSVLINE